MREETTFAIVMALSVTVIVLVFYGLIRSTNEDLKRKTETPHFIFYDLPSLNLYKVTIEGVEYIVTEDGHAIIKHEPWEKEQE